MRELRKMLLPLVTGVIAVGYGPGGRGFVPLTDPAFLSPTSAPTQRYELQGFSFSPPAGENWFTVSSSHPTHPAKLLPHTAQTLLMIKKLRESPPTRPEEGQTIFALVVTTVRFGELSSTATDYLRFKARELEEQYRGETRTGQFRPVEFKASIDGSLGTDCLRYDKVVENHRDERFPGAVFIISDHNFLCPHPEFPRFVAILGYSQRYLRGEQPLPAENEITPFFKSLMFTPIRPLETKRDEAITNSEAARQELDRLYIPYTPGALLAHAQAGNSETVRLLLSAGLNPNAAHMDVFPLLVAAVAGHTDVTRVLLANGAHVNAKHPKAGLTALMAAASTGRTETVKALLAGGADANAKDATGKTALVFAKGKGHTAIVELLKQAGAKSKWSQTEAASPLYPICENDRWGLIDTSGKVVLPPRFERVGPYPYDWSPPPALPKPLEAAAQIAGAKPVTDRVIPIRLDGKAGFATRYRQVLALGRYEETGSRFNEERIQVRSGGRYGFADERGELVIPAQFDLARSFEGGFAFVKVGNHWGVIDRDGRMFVSPTWDEVDHFPGDEWARARRGDRWGVIDRSGQVVIPLQFVQISRPVGPQIFAVNSSGSVYVRPGGTIAFELKCPRALLGTPQAEGHPYFGESAIVKCGRRYGLIDLQGNFVLEPAWDDIRPFYERRAIVKSGGMTGVIDDSGRFIVRPGEVNVFSYQEGVAPFARPGSPKVGLLDREGRIVLEPTFEQVAACGEGLCVARAGGKSGYIAPTGHWAIEPRFWRANRFLGPLATVEQPVGEYMNEVAYIDRKGNVIYRMQFTGFINPVRRQ